MRRKPEEETWKFIVLALLIVGLIMVVFAQKLAIDSLDARLTNVELSK